MEERFFKIDSSSAVREYIDIGNAFNGDTFDNIAEHCLASEFQHLTHAPITIEVAPDSGELCQAMIYIDHVPLISERMKEVFDAQGVDNLFYKKVILTKSASGMKELYWLALPPRIDCLNRRKTQFEDEDEDRAEKIVISPRKVGNYKIFKLSGVSNKEIIITEDLAEALKKADLLGLYITDI